MRALASLLLVAALGSCAAQSGSSEASAFPTLSSLHDDPQKRADQLDSADMRPEAEHKAGRSEKELQAETVAATAAALVGMLFSTSSNVVVGTRTRFDENLLVTEQHTRGEPLVDPHEPPPGACLLINNRPKICDRVKGEKTSRPKKKSSWFSWTNIALGVGMDILRGVSGR